MGLILGMVFEHVSSLVCKTIVPKAKTESRENRRRFSYIWLNHVHLFFSLLVFAFWKMALYMSISLSIEWTIDHLSWAYIFSATDTNYLQQLLNDNKIKPIQPYNYCTGLISITIPVRKTTRLSSTQNLTISSFNFVWKLLITCDISNIPLPSSRIVRQKLKPVEVQRRSRSWTACSTSMSPGASPSIS